METTISKDLRLAEEKVKLDAACKKLLSEKQILAWIMQSCMEEYKNCSIQDIAEKYIEGAPHVAEVAVLPDETNAGNATKLRSASSESKSINEGTVTYDIHFHATAPDTEGLIELIINVEAQKDFYPGYPLVKRSIYYLGRMISSQYGTEFTSSHYEKVKKVYSIWICLDPPAYRQNTINRYRMVEEHLAGSIEENPKNYDLLTSIMICLGDAGESEHKILSLLDELFRKDKEAHEKAKVIEENFGIKMDDGYRKELGDMCNYSDYIEERGIKKGLEQGLEQGRDLELVDCVKKLMANAGWSLEEAMRILGVEKEKEEMLKEAVLS